jgi:hypothetical protein
MSGLVIGDPVTLAAALASPRVIPGDTLLLRAGTYSGNYNVNVSGNAANWITIRPYQNERAIVNGQFRINSDYVRVIGLESVNNTVRDRSNTVGTVGFDCLGNYNEIINCAIRDHDQGITTGAVKTGHIYYGNLVYFNGWDTGWGHGTYPQNNAGNTKTIKRNVFIDNFGYGIHAYGGSGQVSDFIVDGNVCAENGAPRAVATTNILIGGSSGLDGLILRNNLTYKREGTLEGRTQIGYGTGNQALDVSVYDNYFVSPRDCLVFVDVTPTRYDGNTIIGWANTTDLATWTNNTNTSGHASDPVVYPTTNNQTFLTSNEYDANRAQLTIYNWTLGNTVNVDVSSVFGASGTVEAHNAQDYFTDIQTLTITAGVIMVNMQAANRTVATPVGWTAPAKTFPQFGAFVLVKQ